MIGISLGSSDDLSIKAYNPDDYYGTPVPMDEKVAIANQITWLDYELETGHIIFEFMFNTALEIRKMVFLTNEDGQTPKTYDLSLPSCLLTVITPYDLVILADYEFGSESASAIP